MTNTYYTSLSGMMAASYGLQNTSNNVANMQTPGFKRNDVFYSSLGNGNGEQGLGCGVRVGGNATNFSKGQYLPSDNPSDLAINGDGFFVIKLKSGEFLYTRNGEFHFNEEGILVDRNSNGQVQGYDSSGNLVPIHAYGPKTSKGVATQNVCINGQFVVQKYAPDPNLPAEPNPPKYQNITFELKNIYDDQGKAHTLMLEFSPNSMNYEELELTRIDYDGYPINCVPGQIIYLSGSGGSRDQHAIKFAINNSQTINVNFGTYDDGENKSVKVLDGSQSNNQNEKTQINIHQNDGYGNGKQIGFSFDRNGQISYNYDNGQNIQGDHVGLARFDDMENNLLQTHDSLFRTKTDKGIHFGRANQGGFGSIEPKKIESANVDSTTEFANIVVLQRMFQACSQIMDIDKQLLEELESK